MKSFLTILLLSSAIFALIDETPVVEAVPESQKTDLIINMDQLKGLSHSKRHSARKAKQVHSRNMEASQDKEETTSDLNLENFSIDEFPCELQSEIETLKDAISRLDNAMNKDTDGQTCFSMSTGKVIKKSLEDYQDLFLENHKEALSEVIDKYRENDDYVVDVDERKKRRQLSSKTGTRNLKVSHKQRRVHRNRQ